MELGRNLYEALLIYQAKVEPGKDVNPERPLFGLWALS